jgi:hypothetical protein
MERFEEAMSGQPVGPVAPGADVMHAEEANSTQPEAPPPDRKSHRMRRFEEIMSGRSIPDQEMEPGETDSQ